MTHSAPEIFSEIILSSEALGAAVIAFDENNKIKYANNLAKNIYGISGDLKGETYDAMMWRCVNNRLLDSPDMYENPHAWLAAANKFRREVNSKQYIIRHSTGRLYLARPC
jgi:PAS domain-containing protein